MAGIDKSLTVKETPKRSRDTKALLSVMTQQLPSSSVACGDNSTGTLSKLDDNISPFPKSCNSKSHSKKKKKSRILRSSKVTSSLDRVNISDHRALYVLRIVAQALGHSVDELSVSCSTIGCARCRNRQTVTVLQKSATFLQALNEWTLQSQVQGLVFDKTSLNTGIHTGAFTLVENNLDVNLVWITCRHHILEVMLSSTVFSTAFGSSAGPEVGIFKRFKKQRLKMDIFKPAMIHFSVHLRSH